MATRRSNGEGTIWFAKGEGRYRAQYPDASGHRRTITGKNGKRACIHMHFHFQRSLIDRAYGLNESLDRKPMKTRSR